MRSLLIIPLIAVYTAGGAASTRGAVGEASGPAPEIGLRVGDKAPDFELRDQRGVSRTLAGYAKKGIVALLFFRSADW